ncbi:hypothetical protein BJX70DRAFT_395479 [Aspergillus crustosus]
MAPRWLVRCSTAAMMILALARTSDAAALATHTLQPRDMIAGGVELRVLPIGDSITWGAQSSDDAGYRKTLHELLDARGNKVDFVGSMQNGIGMSDQNHEGHRGYTIDGIADASSTGIWAAPNIALLHAGTNDMKDAIDLPNAPNRLADLMDLIWAHSEDAVILVCQIIPSTTSAIQGRVEDFNNALPALVDEYTGKGKTVALVAMNKALTTADLADNLHPKDEGYVKMANAYYAAIEAADEKGWISKPGKAQAPPPSPANAEDCRPTPSWYNVGQIADGAKVAVSDGPFQPSWFKQGVIADGACPRAQLHFMDLDGDGLKDYVCVDPKTGATDAWLNRPDSAGKSSNKWNKLGEVATGAKGRDGGGYCLLSDLNGDGRDDYIYVDPVSGDISAWINQLKSETGVWQWQSLGRIAGGVGTTNNTLQMADIDGDGRADFLLVNPKTGGTTGWLNTGADVVPDYYKLGIIATGGSAVPGTTAYFGDFTGEGRADYMIVGEGGKVKALTNRLQPASLIPRWLGVFVLAEGPDGAEQEEVRLVDMTGDGKVDYLLVDKKGKVTLWENQGTGGKYQPGEGVILCDRKSASTPPQLVHFADTNGDKKLDYVVVGSSTSTGRARSWHNLGFRQDGSIRWNTPLSFADGMTGDQRADYVTVDPDNGALQLWHNRCWSNAGDDDGDGGDGPGGIITDPEAWWTWLEFHGCDGEGQQDAIKKTPGLWNTLALLISTRTTRRASKPCLIIFRGSIMMHEIMHATVMTYKQNKNRKIVDMRMEYYQYDHIKGREFKRRIVAADVYRPWYCKVLARVLQERIVEEAISINADSYANYALSKYIQAKLDNQYPWLPLADRAAIDWYKKTDALLLYENNGTFGINTDALPEAISADSVDGDVSAHDLGEDEVITLTGGADYYTITSLSDYSDSFNNEMTQWSSYVNIPEPDSEDLYGTVFVPPIAVGTGLTKDGQTKALGVASSSEINGGKDNLWLGVSFASGSCTGTFTWPPTGAGLLDTDLCMDRLRSTLQSFSTEQTPACDESITKEKYGGSLKEVCVVYQVLAVSSDKSDPTGTVPSGSHGAVKCEDTDDERFEGTCTCWYEKLPDQTEIFGKPKSGKCSDIDFRPAWTYLEDPDYQPENVTPENH